MQPACSPPHLLNALHVCLPLLFVPPQQTPDITDIQPVPDAFVPMIGIKVSERQRAWEQLVRGKHPAPPARHGAWHARVRAHTRSGQTPRGLCRANRTQAACSRKPLRITTPSFPSRHLPACLPRLLQYKGVQIDILYASLAMQTLPEQLDLSNHAVLRGCDEPTVRALNGCRVTDTMLKLVPRQVGRRGPAGQRACRGGGLRFMNS